MATTGDPLFSNTLATLTNSTSSVGGVFYADNSEWGEIDDDPEMRCDDDFLEYMNSHMAVSGHLKVSSGDPLIGTVIPANGPTVVPWNEPTTTFTYGSPLGGPLGGPASSDAVHLNFPQNVPLPQGEEEVEEDEDYMGWECSRCHIVCAPHVDSCERCAPAWPQP